MSSMPSSLRVWAGSDGELSDCEHHPMGFRLRKKHWEIMTALEKDILGMHGGDTLASHAEASFIVSEGEDDEVGETALKTRKNPRSHEVWARRAMLHEMCQALRKMPIDVD